jgi:Domain of unknown function (DUF1835)/Protein of unknown function
MTHIVFQASDVDTMQEAIKLDASLGGDVIQIKDEFAVGPIANIYETEGYQARRDWWRKVLEFSPYTDALDIVDDKLAVLNLLKQLEEDSSLQVWLWMGQNQHDVCGYYWLMTQLKEYQGRIFVSYLNNLPFINEKGGIFYPTNLFEIQPKEFLKAKKLARPITSSEFEVDPDEWKKLCGENAIVRILEGGKKILSKDETLYDKDIMNAVTAESQKLQKVLHNIFSKMKVRTGDAFLVWRIRELINAGRLEAEGDWNKGWKEIVIKLAGTPTTLNELREVLAS